MIRGYPLLLFCSVSFILLFFLGHNFSGPRVHNVIQNVWPGQESASLEDEVPLFQDGDILAEVDGEVIKVHDQDNEGPAVEGEGTAAEQDTESSVESDPKKTSTSETLDSESSPDKEIQQTDEKTEEDSKTSPSQDKENSKSNEQEGDLKEGLQDDASTADNSTDHQILYSLSTPDKAYFKIKTGDHTIYNPNIIPNPYKNESWIVVGQMGSEGRATWVFSEIFCEAEFDGGELSCEKSPLTLTIPNSPEMQCQPPIDSMNANVGPHDARVFWGPDFPITTYGDNSAYTCFGQFAMDFRTLMSWPFRTEDRVDVRQFRKATELQRPAPYAWLEKNFFLWWDSKGDMYAHYKIKPRIFSKIEYDGSASENLALDTTSAAADEKCLAKYVPAVTGAPEREAIHQATNSLSITLCSRTDPSCKPDESNTYTMAIFQHKNCRITHNVYEPYVMLFKQDAPFTIYGISQKPLWYHGRGHAGEKNQPAEETQRPENESEMVYTTSMSWKNSTQRHHGYLDDELFIAFGLEDYRAGGIDVLAETLIGSLGMCEGDV